MKWFRKALILTHRYLGIGLSLLFVTWFISGIGMIYTGGMPRLTAAERLDRLPALDVAHIRLTAQEAASKAGVGGNPREVLLITIMDRPAYRFAGRGRITVFADNGELLGDVAEADAIAIAGRFVDVPLSALHWVRELDEADQWTLELRRELPLQKITVEDAARTELYVSETTGEVVMKTTRRSRAAAWVAAIPHWLYFRQLRLNGLLWTRVVVWTSGLATISALIGVVLVFTQFRVKYSGLMRWHYLLGTVFGVVTVTWAFSGLLSMEPFGWFSRGGGGGERIPQELSGGPLDLAAFQPIDVDRWKLALAARPVKEVEFLRVQGDPYYVLRGLEPRPVLMSATSLQIRREPFPVESIVERVKRGYPGAPIADVQQLSQYDAYYYDRYRSSAPLPVVRVKFGDDAGTWVYIDGGMSQALMRFTRRQRLERWLYHGLHSLDFPFWYHNRPLWDVGVIVLLAGGTILSAIGTIIGYRRVRRGIGRTVGRPAKV